MLDLAVKIIAIEEGFSSAPYSCIEQYPTVGYGCRIGNKNDPLPNFILPQPVALFWLQHNISEIEKQLTLDLWNLNGLDVRRAVMISMAYQLGVEGCLKFKKTWEHIRLKNWDLAAEEMLASRWARQTARRARRHSEMMRTNALDSYYQRKIPK